MENKENIIKDQNDLINKDIIKQDRLIKSSEYIFIGDRTMKGGNDYPLAKLMKKTDKCSFYQTEGWEQTQKILESLND